MSNKDVMRAMSESVSQLELEGRLRHAAQRLGSTLLFQALHGDLIEQARIALLAIDETPANSSHGKDLNILLGFAIAIIAREETS